MKTLIGLDPGGNSNFGWCLVTDSDRMPFSVLKSGCGDSADHVIREVLQAILIYGPPVAVGIDAPLFWSRVGPRNADSSVRTAIRNRGAPHSSGMVQDVNSLRGACLVQGMLAAMSLREKFPSLLITEAHPKALRYLLPETRTISAPSEHERDAMLSAITAWAAFHKHQGWSDLYSSEPCSYTPISPPLHYFMPGVDRLDAD